MVETKEEKKVEKKEVVARLVEVATQFGLVIELPDGRRVSSEELLLEIYNKLLKLEKAI